MEAEPDQPEGAGTIGRPVADEHRRLLRPPQGRTAVRRARGATTPGSPGCGATSRRRAPTFSTSSRSRLKTGKVLTKVSPLAEWTDEGRLAVREGARHSAAAALRARVIRASAASRAPRCRSIRRTRGRAAGRARSSNAGFISSPPNRLWASGFRLQASGFRLRTSD